MFDEKNFDRRKKRGKSQRENNWKGKKKMEGGRERQSERGGKGRNRR